MGTVEIFVWLGGDFRWYLLNYCAKACVVVVFRVGAKYRCQVPGGDA